MCRNERAPVRGATLGQVPGGALHVPAHETPPFQFAAVITVTKGSAHHAAAHPRQPCLQGLWGRPRPASLAPVQPAFLTAQHQYTHPMHAAERQRGCWAPAAGGGAALCSPTNLALCSAAALWFDAAQQQRQRRCSAAAAAAGAAATASPAWRRGGPTRFCGRGCPCWA